MLLAQGDSSAAARSVGAYLLQRAAQGCEGSAELGKVLDILQATAFPRILAKMVLQGPQTTPKPGRDAKAVGAAEGLGAAHDRGSGVSDPSQDGLSPVQPYDGLSDELGRPCGGVDTDWIPQLENHLGLVRPHEPWKNAAGDYPDGKTHGHSDN